MATTDYDFNTTRNELIARAFRIIGAKDLGQPLTGDELSQGIEALNSMVALWQSDHVFLWLLTHGVLAISSGTETYNLPTDPRLFALEKAWLKIGSIDHDLEVISYRDYLNIPDKSASGDPVAIAMDAGLPTPTVYLYPVPNANRNVWYTAYQRLKDFDTASGNPDFPIRYIKALAYGLAADLAPEYGISIQEQRELRGMADQFFVQAKKGERERAEFEFVGGAFEK